MSLNDGFQGQPKVIAAVQVRMGSSRLPGKVLRPVLGKPLLGHLLDRLALCRRLDGVVVATSVRPENQAIADYCAARGTPCFRGDEDDVLGRMLGALESCSATVGVEVFGDCPLIDPALVDDCVGFYLDHRAHYDFVGNDLKTTFPPGMEVEVFSLAALADAGRRTGDPAIREHGTLFIRQNPELYRLFSIEAPPELRRPEVEIEVDTEEDLVVIAAVLERFADRPDVGLRDILAFLDANPEIRESNAAVARRWKQYRTDGA